MVCHCLKAKKPYIFPKPKLAHKSRILKILNISQFSPYITIIRGIYHNQFKYIYLKKQALSWNIRVSRARDRKSLVFFINPFLSLEHGKSYNFYNFLLFFSVATNSLLLPLNFQIWTQLMVSLGVSPPIHPPPQPFQATRFSPQSQFSLIPQNGGGWKKLYQNPFI